MHLGVPWVADFINLRRICAVGKSIWNQVLETQMITELIGVLLLNVREINFINGYHIYGTEAHKHNNSGIFLRLYKVNFIAGFKESNGTKPPFYASPKTIRTHS